jgi:Domain of unknown function (DUF5666)
MKNRIRTATAVGLALLGFGGSAYAEDKMIGNLSAVDAGAKTLTVQETGTSEATTFSVDGKTVIREGRKEVPLATLETGRSVKVTFVKADGVAVARHVDLSVPMGADKSTPVPVHAHETK